MTKDADGFLDSIHSYFGSRRLTLAVAESCTGGLICDLITDRPGASGFLAAGVVAYGSRAKEVFAGVSAELIARHGMVSREAAVAMAEGVRRLAAADWGVSTTGNLGPETLEDKEKGLVYVAVSHPEGSAALELHLRGGRRRNKEDAAVAALGLLADTAVRGLHERKGETPS